MSDPARKPRSTAGIRSRYQHLPLALVVCLGIGLSALLFISARARERARIHADFERAAENRADALRQHLDQHLLELETIAAFHAASQEVTRDEFREFVRPVLARRQGVQALASLRRVPHAERAAYEGAARKDGLAEFQITELNARGEMVRATPRAEYFPIHFAEASGDSGTALGFDLASNPTRSKALNDARDTGKVVATGQIRPVQETGSQFGFLIFLPMYQKGAATDTVEARRENLAGFVLAVLRIGDVVTEALAHLGPEGVDIYIFDTAAPTNERLLYAHSSRKRATPAAPIDEATDLHAGEHHEAMLAVGRRQWLVLCRPTREFLVAKRTWQPWVFLAGGPLLSGFVTAYILLVLGRAARTRRLAAEQARAKRELELEIRERTQAEAALAQHRNLLQTILAQAGDAIVVCDAQGRPTFINAAARRLALRDPWETTLDISLSAWGEGYYPDGRLVPPEEWLFTMALRGKAVASTERHMIRADGSSYDVLVSMAPLRTSNGEIIGAVATFADIAERKKVEAELQAATRAAEEANRLMNNILSSVSSIVIAVDENDRITQWNPAAQRTFDVPAREALGKSLAECGATWDNGEALETIAACRDADGPFHLEDIRFTRPNGTPGLLAISVNPMKDDQGGYAGFVLLGADVTERTLMEEQLSRAQKLESVGALAAGIAHEINTPIQFVGDNTRFLFESFEQLQQVLHAYHELKQALDAGAVAPAMLDRLAQLEKDSDVAYLTEEIPKAIGQTLEGVERVATIVRAMKDFSHPNGAEKMLADVNHALENTLTVAHNELKYVADVVTDLDPDLPPVPCYLGDLNQVFLNLLVNAAHAITEAAGQASGDRGTITVSTRREGREAVIRIADTGAGIPEAVCDRVFEPFFTTKEVGKGTGQGLAIAHNVVVEKHRGALTFDTKIGTGTTFTIRLPF